MLGCGQCKRQIGTRDLVDTLGVRRFELFLHPAVTFAHR